MLAKKIEINWHPDLSIYASEPFLKAVGDEYGWLGGFDNSEKLCCILPYTIVKKAIFRMVRFRVETILVEDVDVHEEKTFLNSAVEYFRSIGADMIIPATTNSIFRTYPDNADAAPYGSHIIDLTLPEDNLWSNLSSSHRRKVRLAKKAGIDIKSGIEYLDTAYDLVRDTFKRSKMGFMDRKAFSRYVQSLGPNAAIFVAEHDGTIQGSIVIPFSKHCAYYVYGGSIPKPKTGAMNLLHWEAIRQLKEISVKSYDFVGIRINPDKGSKQEGLLMFKERFGGKIIKGYMWKYSMQPLKYRVYSLAIKFLRGGDIVDSERHKL